MRSQQFRRKVQVPHLGIVSLAFILLLGVHVAGAAGYRSRPGGRVAGDHGDRDQTHGHVNRIRAKSARSGDDHRRYRCTRRIRQQGLRRPCAGCSSK